MRRSRRARLSDEQAERLLAGDDAPVEGAAPLSALTSELREAGRTPPSDAVAERHLAAIAAEVRDTRHRDAAPAPAPRPVRRAGAVFRGLLVPRRLTAAAAAFTAVIVLAIAGALPGAVQAAAADLLAVVGIAVPDGRGTSQPQDDAPAPRIERRGRSLAEPSQAPAVTGAPKQGTRGDRRDRPRRTGPAGTDGRPSDRPASVTADRRADDRDDDGGDDRVGGSDDDADREDDDRDDDAPEAIDDDERPSAPETDADTDSGEDTDEGPEEDREDTPELRSAGETTHEGD